MYETTSSRWILLGSVIIIIVLEGGQKLATISDIASLYKKNGDRILGQQQLFMVNNACGFNQSETGKYFE